MTRSDLDGTTEAPSTEISVLHVDDDAQIGDLVAAQLESIDDRMTVFTEHDARGGLERLTTGSIDCVVSDYQMPGMDGIEFLEAVREEYPNIPFFLFTGRGSEEVASEAIDAGVTSYLQKGGIEGYDQLANRISNAVGRQYSERRAKVAHDRLLELYEQADGFFIVETDWTVTYWNQVMAERTGVPSEDVIGESLWEVFPEATETEAYERYHEAMAERCPVEFETHYDPHEYWVEARVYPVDEGLSIHSRNITEKKEREQQLEHRNQVLESFANTVSHDLRNPLNVAEGRLQLAQKTGDFEHLDEVAQAHNRMRNLIDELLRIARGEEVSLSEISLREYAEEAWETVSTERMELTVTEDARFEAHPSQLRRLLENLFWNSLEHGEADTVRVGVFGAEGIYVEDDGVGIPPAEREEVFETGFSTIEGNPGYGLHIVEGIIDVHGWEITVTEGIDGGARFEIRGCDFIER